MYVRLLTNNFLSEKAVGKSESKDVHLAVLRVLPEVIRESVDADASSKSVIIYDPASGEKKMVSPTAVDGIESLGEVKTAEQREAEINGDKRTYAGHHPAKQGLVGGQRSQPCRYADTIG